MSGLLLDLHSPVQLLLKKGSRRILLETLPSDIATTLHEFLQLAGTNPFEALVSHPFRRGSHAWLSLLDFFELEDNERTRGETPDTRQPAGTAYPLFKHQRDAVRRIQAALDAEPRRVLLHMPTGAGKTRTAMNVIADHLRAAEPALVIWLAFSQELCEQAACEFSRAWSHLGNRSVSLYRFWGNHELDLSNLHDGLLVAGLAKASRTARNDLTFLPRLGDRARLIVIDEAHQAIAETYRNVLTTLHVKRPGNALMGLSATPGRTWAQVEVDQELANFFSRKKVALQVDGYNNPIDFLIAQGYLSKPTFEPLEYGDGPIITQREEHRLARELEVPISILRKLGDHELRNLKLLQRISQLTQEHRRILVFCATVEHARLLTGVLRSRNHDARFLSSETPQPARDTIIQDFRSSSEKPMILCNFGILTTGFDAPKTSAVVIARPTKSLVLYSQMVGRGIRGPSVGGNEHSLIITVIDRDLPGFGDLGEAFLNWEDVWDD